MTCPNFWEREMKSNSSAYAYECIGNLKININYTYLQNTQTCSYMHIAREPQCHNRAVHPWFQQLSLL